MKNGLFTENDELIYYKHDKPRHAGAIEIDGAIYYIGRGGRAAKGRHVVHREMTNGLLVHGTYTFDDDGKLVEGSYVAPTKVVKTKKKSSKKRHVRKKHRMKKKDRIRLIAAAAFAAVLTVVLTVLALWHPNDPKPDTVAPVQTAVKLPSFEEDVVLSSSAAQSLFEGKISASEAILGGDPYRAMTFAYNLNGKVGHLHLSESAALTNARYYTLSPDSNNLLIDNLKTDTTYYYEVRVDEEVYEGNFHTADGFRFVRMEGVANTRDIGGAQTLNGRTVKQGMIIRGTELDALVDTRYFLSARAIDNVMATFGFVYDFDLRASTLYIGDNYVSRLGETVGHAFYTAPMYGSVFSAGYRDSLKRIFADLANPANYPMYMHCTYGADRTGTVVFLLQGLLGMSEEDMLREYRLTAFETAAYADADDIDQLIVGLARYEGNTVGERIEQFLIRDIGVTAEQIASIRRIMLED